jgi:inorganic pyrophosphatase
MVEVIVEIPRWSFLKRGTTGHVDFVSPFPCPFNYGSVPTHVGLEGDLLDALILGPRLARGSRVTVRAFGAVGLTDRGLYDDKLICSRKPLRYWQRTMVLPFFHFYALCKRLLNYYRGRPGPTRCEGWGDAAAAIARSSPRDSTWRGPEVPF